MLNGKHIIIAHQTKLAYKILPEQLVMAIADAAENPGTMNLIGIGMSIQCTVDCSIDGINFCIFRMDMENRLTAQLG